MVTIYYSWPEYYEVCWIGVEQLLFWTNFLEKWEKLKDEQYVPGAPLNNLMIYGHKYLPVFM